MILSPPVAMVPVSYTHLDVYKRQLPAGKQVLDVLGDAGGNPAPFSEPFPDFNGIGGGLVLLEQQVHLVNVVPGGLVGGAVDGDAVPHLIVIGNPPLLPYLPIW